MSAAPKILDLMAAIRTAYPDATPADLKASLTPQFLAAAYGKMPRYSSLAAPALHPIKTATVGSFVLCHAVDKTVRDDASKSFGETVIALIKRGDKGPNGEDRYGVLGGYTELGSETTAGEQPKEGAVRELKEEAINDQGEPVISPEPARLKLLISGIDYSNPKLPTNYNGHSLELTAAELALLKQHSFRLQNEPAYKEAARLKSGGEVSGLQILPISQVLKMPPGAFKYPHEFEAIVMLDAQLKQQSMGAQR